MPDYNSQLSPACRHQAIRAGDADPSIRRPGREFPECLPCRPFPISLVLLFSACSPGLAGYLLQQFVNRPFQLLIPTLINHTRHVFHPDDRFSLVIIHTFIRPVPCTDCHLSTPRPLRPHSTTCTTSRTTYT